MLMRRARLGTGVGHALADQSCACGCAGDGLPAVCMCRSPQEQPVADPMGAPKIKATPCQALLSVRILPWSRVGERARDRG